MSTELELQRAITKLALAALDAYGFALAGSGAIREHGIIHRPSLDVDLFTDRTDPAAFAAAIDQLRAALEAAGYAVAEARRAPLYAKLIIETSTSAVEVDLGADWRAHAPVLMSLGPVLDLADAIGNKIAALYSRTAPRDFIDGDAIRASQTFSDETLLADATQRDPGFDKQRFIQQLRQVDKLTPAMVEPYGLTTDDLDELKARITRWATDLTGP